MLEWFYLSYVIIYHIKTTLKSNFWRTKRYNFVIIMQRCYQRHNVSRKSVNH